MRKSKLLVLVWNSLKKEPEEHTLIGESNFIRKKEGKLKNFVTIGRKQDRDITINDDYVSKEQGFFSYREGGFFYFDNGSTNGSYVFQSYKLHRFEGVEINKQTQIDISQNIHLECKPYHTTTKSLSESRLVKMTSNGRIDHL